MNNSLSVILPIHNAQNSLSDKVEQLLDVLCDLTSEFEIVIVDDASTDSTPEVADELSRRYPQITHLGSSERIGIDQSIQMGRRAASGQNIFMHDGRSPMQIDALARGILESELEGSTIDLNLASLPEGPQAIDDGLVERLMHWGDALRRESDERVNAPIEPIDGVRQLDENASHSGREIDIAALGDAPTRMLDSADAHSIPTKLGRNHRRVENREKGEFWF